MRHQAALHLPPLHGATAQLSTDTTALPRVSFLRSVHHHLMGWTLCASKLKTPITSQLYIFAGMIKLLQRTRRPDITFCRNGRISITARVVRLLSLQPGDSINIAFH